MTTSLPLQDKGEDRIALIARDPEDHREWEQVLPYAVPLYLWRGDDHTFVRWAMTRENAERFGLWGAGCQCCGATADSTGDTWEFDTRLDQVMWYLGGDPQ